MILFLENFKNNNLSRKLTNYLNSVLFFINRSNLYRFISCLNSNLLFILLIENLNRIFFSYNEKLLWINKLKVILNPVIPRSFFKAVIYHRVISILNSVILFLLLVNTIGFKFNLLIILLILFFNYRSALQVTEIC